MAGPPYQSVAGPQYQVYHRAIRSEMAVVKHCMSVGSSCCLTPACCVTRACCHVAHQGVVCARVSAHEMSHESTGGSDLVRVRNCCTMMCGTWCRYAHPDREETGASVSCCVSCSVSTKNANSIITPKRCCSTVVHTMYVGVLWVLRLAVVK